MTERDDLPMISAPDETATDTPNKIEEPPVVKATPKQPPAPIAAKPALSLKASAEPAKPAAIVKAPTEGAMRREAPPASKPAPIPAPGKIEAARPAPDESGDILQSLRKVESVIAEHKKAVAERETLRQRVAELEHQLAQARTRLVEAEKSDAQVRDLQQKLDAALLSHSMIATDSNKTKIRLAEVETKLTQADSTASASKKELDGALASLNTHARAREEAERRVAAALAALQGQPPAKK